MGTLTYANLVTPIEIDDRVLAHLRAVTVTKLRRNEPFALTLPAGADGASETLWVHASIPVRFEVDSEVALQRPLLTSMMQAASSSSGLDLTDPDLARAAEAAHAEAVSA